jgi:hypothetical protein
MEFSMAWAREEPFGASCKKIDSAKLDELEQLIDG